MDPGIDAQYEKLERLYKEMTLEISEKIENNGQFLEKNSQLLQEIINRQKEKGSSEVIILGDKLVILANDENQFPGISNPKWDRARLFVSALFTPAHSGGISVYLMYNTQRIGDKPVIRLKSSNGAASGASEPINIAHLTGFSFLVKNHDSSNSTQINNFKVILYNK